MLCTNQVQQWQSMLMETVRLLSMVVTLDRLGVPSGEPCDLIYALGNATVTINGGTFKATTPANTLNVNDSARGKAKIIVNGGKFYKYDPSNPAMGPNEVFLGEGCKVTKDGDWYVVSR